MQAIRSNNRSNYKRLGAKPPLLWAIAFFFLFQASINVFVDKSHPEVIDLESVVRLKLLRDRMEENPDRPLLLMVGSSRTEMNFVPEELPPIRSASGEAVLPFNFSHLGAGPIMNLVQVNRLLRAGIHPKWFVIEVMPPQLGDEKQSILHNATWVRDQPLVARFKNPWLTYALFIRGHLTPCYKHRAFMINHFLPQWASAAESGGEDKVRSGLGRLGGDYACSAVPFADEAVVRVRTAKARASYLPDLQDNFFIAESSARAMIELLELCRREQIHAALLISPEGEQFQSWYSPNSRRKVDEYCAKLSQKFEVPIIDARNWLPESDFVDSHHVLLSGAKKFTLRLGVEALQPFVEGKLRFDSASHSTVSRSAR